MKKIFILIVVLVKIMSFVNAQSSIKSPVDSSIQKLIELKVDYEKYKGTNKKGDSILSLYEIQIDNIKEAKNVYLSYINLALKKNKTQLAMEWVPYKYLTVIESNISLRRNLIKKIDLYRIIKYSLFERNDKLLPEDFRGLPVVDEKNYNGYNPNKRGEYKIATKYLLNNLSLSPKEIKFIKNCDNQVYILDIKRYIVTNGLSSDNNAFIIWAINYLIKYPGVSIANLDNSYEPIKSNNYVPKDRGITIQH